jgi:hypothetical protein
MVNTKPDLNTLNNNETVGWVLDCGHGPYRNIGKDGKPSIGTGVAHWRDADGTEQRICYACAHKREVELLRTESHAFAYLVKDDTKPGYTKWKLTDWPGGTLLHVWGVWETPHNIGGSVYRVQAFDKWGNRWYGMGPGRRGNGEYVRLRKLKTKLQVLGDNEFGGQTVRWGRTGYDGWHRRLSFKLEPEQDDEVSA